MIDTEGAKKNASLGAVSLSPPLNRVRFAVHLFITYELARRDTQAVSMPGQVTGALFFRFTLRLVFVKTESCVGPRVALMLLSLVVLDFGTIGNGRTTAGVSMEQQKSQTTTHTSVVNNVLTAEEKSMWCFGGSDNAANGFY